MKLPLVSLLGFLALCSCATTPTQTQSNHSLFDGPTQIQSVELHSQTEGAVINLNGENIGYTPLTIKVRTFVDTGTIAGIYEIHAVPTSPGEYTQEGAFWGPVARSYIFYMYNTAR